MERGTAKGLMAKRPNGWAAALIGSVALHGLVLAAVVGMGQPDPPEALPVVAVTVITEAPPGAGRASRPNGAAQPSPGAASAKAGAVKTPTMAKPVLPVRSTPKRNVEPKPTPKPRATMAQRLAAERSLRQKPAPKRPATMAQRLAAERTLRQRPAPEADPPKRVIRPVKIDPVARKQTVRRPPRVRPKPKPPVSRPARRFAAQSARRKSIPRPTRPSATPVKSATGAGSLSGAQVAFGGAAGAAVYRPPRLGGGGGGNRMPRYPEDARERGAEGRVVLEVAVDATGRARAVRVVRSSGEDDLDAAALKAVRGWRFKPARRGGLPVAGTATVPIRFRLVEE